MCWESVLQKRTMRAIGPSGPLMGYVLIPVILSGGREWVGHLLILLILLAAVIATTSLASRCGADRRQSTLAGLIFASTPVVLGMAGTVMPDIPATALGVFGIERLLAWKAQRKLHQALVAGLALGLAPLGRAHTLLLLPVGALMVAGDSFWPLSWRRIREAGLVRWAPVLMAAAAFVFFTWLTYVPSPTAVFPTAPNAYQVGVGNIRRNLESFGADWMLATAFGIAWMILDGWRGIMSLGVILLAGQAASDFLDYPIASYWSLSLAGLLALTFALVETWRTRKPAMFGLALWLWVPLAIMPYIHFPMKYLAVCAPAAAILMAWKISRLTKLRLAVACGAIVCTGTALGLAILKADADFAGSAREEVAREITPHVRAGGQAWFFGQWALNWYAEKAGATCLTSDPPYPHSGDLLIADRLDGSARALDAAGTFRGRLIQMISPGDPGGRIYNPEAGAGFYSNRVGFWPWSWSSEPLNTYYVWVLE